LASVSQLLVLRFLTRSDRAAWLVLFGLVAATRIGEVLPLQPWIVASPFFLVILVALPTLGYLVVLSRFGVLGAAVFATADMALTNTPLTWDVTCWYFWRTAVVVAMLLGVAYWGFRNVLGRQTAFPEGTLEP
jgi:hypothetical protein